MKDIVELSTELKLNAISDALAYGATPSFEHFLDLSGTEEKTKFFKDLQPGHIVIGKITTVEKDGVGVRLCCVDKGFARDLWKFHLQVFLFQDELHTLNNEDPFGVYVENGYVRALVRSVDTVRRHIVICVKSGLADCQEKLGIISYNDLPSYYRAGEAWRREQAYDRTLRRSRGFKNVSAVKVLCSHFGISHKCGAVSLLPELNRSFAQEDFAQELRKQQSHRMAVKYVARGVECFRSGDAVVALQQFNKALEVDQDNVEGLVARGALHANSHSWQEAIEDLEKALTLDAKHANANRYLQETLLAKAKSHEEKDEINRAVRCFRRVYQLNPSHRGARRKLKKYTGQYPDELASRTGNVEKANSTTSKRSREHSVTIVGQFTSTVASSGDVAHQEVTQALTDSQNLMQQLESYYKKLQSAQHSEENLKALGVVQEQLDQYYAKFRELEATQNTIGGAPANGTGHAKGTSKRVRTRSSSSSGTSSSTVSSSSSSSTSSSPSKSRHVSPAPTKTTNSTSSTKGKKRRLSSYQDRNSAARSTSATAHTATAAPDKFTQHGGQHNRIDAEHSARRTGDGSHIRGQRHSNAKFEPTPITKMRRSSANKRTSNSPELTESDKRIESGLKSFEDFISKLKSSTKK